MSMLIAYLLAGAAAGSPLQPTGKWVVEFADSACVASRSFGTPEDRLDLHLKAPLLGQNYEVAIVIPDTKQPRGNGFDHGWIERADGSQAAPITAISYSTVAKTQMTRFHVDSEKYVIGQDGERIILQINKQRRYDFTLPGLKNAQRVLDQCLSGLRKEFGVSDEVRRQIATAAASRGSIVRYFTTNDYPWDAVQKGEQGQVGVLFWIEVNGRVAECRVIETSHRQSLDDRTCEVIRQRARFKPALDLQGSPIRSPQFQRIRWIMPDD